MTHLLKKENDYYTASYQDVLDQAKSKCEFFEQIHNIQKL